MGAVYRAHDPRLERTVAIKVLLSATDDRQRQRLQTEARSLARLRHPNIVEVFDIGVTGRFPYVVMEFVPGTSLQRQLDLRQRLPPEEAARIVRKLAGAMEYAHASGVLHRDIKPDNVLVADDGEPRLTDFGLAKDLRDASGRQLSTTGQFLGTPGFWPPEQAQGEVAQIGVGSDVYALGATLYALLAGRPPFLEASAWECALATVETPAPSLAESGVQVPAELETICRRCLEKSPADRYPSAGALAEALERYLRGEPQETRSSRGLWIAASLLICALGGSAGALALVASKPSPPSAASRAPSATPAQEPTPTTPPPATPDRTLPPATPDRTAELERELAEARQAARREKASRLLDQAKVLTQVNSDWKGAIKLYTEAIQLDPTFAEAYRGRGINKFGAGDLAGAQADLEEAIHLDPSSAEAYQYRGMTYLAQRQPKASLADLTHSLELAPGRGDGYSYRGLAYLTLGRLNEAVADFERALELLPPQDPSVPMVKAQLKRARAALQKR